MSADRYDQRYTHSIRVHVSQQTRITSVDNFKTLQILVYDCEANCSFFLDQFFVSWERGSPESRQEVVVL
jgi:hypothetical protein